MRMRAVDAAECYPFGGSGCRVEGEPLPPMDPTPRYRWWKHELEAVRARLAAAGARGGEAATAGGEGGAPRKGTKRKESRSSSAAERAKKRRRMLQFRSFLKNKEKTSKPHSTSRLHQHMLHMAFLRKHRSSTVRTRAELESRDKVDEAWDHMLPHENSVNKQSRDRMDPSNETHSNLFWRKELDSSVNKQHIEVSGSTNCPTNTVSGSTNCPTNTGCEVVKHATGPKDDIFGDLPLLELESSKTMFRAGVDELPTVIEESYITSQSEADSIPEAVPLKLIDASDITTQTPSPLDDLVQSEVSPHNEPSFISHSDASGSQPSTVGINGLPHHNISVMKPGPGSMQLKLNGSALNSHSDLRSKCGSSNPLQGCFNANKNCSQEIKKHGTGSAASLPAMKTRTEATKYKDSSVMGKKSTDISAVVALPALTNHRSSQVTVLPSAVAQGISNTRTSANDIRSMPAKECNPSTRLSGNFRSNVDPYGPPSTDSQGSWHSKLPPICSPANIGMAFMKLPGLERMEISNCGVKIGENKYRSGQSMNTVRFQKEQLASGMINVIQGQQKIGLNNSQAGKTILDACLGQSDQLQQPTMRLMGKTVSVCNHNKDHNVPSMGKVCPDNVPIEANYLSTASRQLPQKRSFPCQDSVIPSAHLNDSSDFLSRIPKNSVPGQNTSFSGLHNQRLQQKNTASSTIKDCTWNFGSRFAGQSELNKASMVSTNAKTRHLELRQPPHSISIPQNQQSHLWTPASHMNRKDHSFMGSAANQCSPVPQSLIKASMNKTYEKSTLLSYDDPSSVPICQPYQIPGEKLSSASARSFLDCGVDKSSSRSSSPGLSLSLTTGRPICAANLTNANGRKDADSADPVSNARTYTDNVSQQPAKRQLVTDRQDFMSMDLNIVSHSPGWSLSDAVGPQVLDFSKRVARDAVQPARNESNNNSRATSGQVPAIESRSRAGVVAGVNAMLRPGQNLNDHSKLLYSTKFPIDNGINSVVL
ncbi:hypothetical protein HU200_037204 [Digitaria exilis]|uniref:Uncharacterized protein n=1 Tax=Digitaria exilis TaxID=1010633 RepID=A0A835BG74_9POAL|nr:hypothetical protein HU200_037204 [Digitaria exilis]